VNLKKKLKKGGPAVFSFEAVNRRISPAIAIKSLAMNFSRMG
jgi:hypothetical protein